MILRGRAHRFGSNINTDYIIASKYKAKTSSIAEMAKHLMEDIDPDFVQRLRSGDFIVAGPNFGCGSSREAAPRVIKEAGIAAVIAPSFARIFFRNSINVGLPLLMVDTAAFEAGDELEVDLASGRVADIDRNTAVVSAAPLPQVILNIIADGGLAAHVRRHGGFMLD